MTTWRIDAARGLTLERLHQLLDYDPATGTFTRRTGHGSVKSGGIAGTIGHQGYRWIGIDGTLYAASRLAHLWMMGEWPPEEMDHINRDRADNRWENLRAVSRGQNMSNRKLPRRGDLPTGVTPSRHKFRAQIRVNGKFHHLGVFETPEDAGAAYQRALQNVMTDGRAVSPTVVDGGAVR